MRFRLHNLGVLTLIAILIAISTVPKHTRAQQGCLPGLSVADCQLLVDVGRGDYSSFAMDEQITLKVVGLRQGDFEFSLKGNGAIDVSKVKRFWADFKYLHFRQNVKTT